MAPLITFPHTPWLKRLSVGLAGALIGLSLLVLLGWVTQTDELVQIRPGLPAIEANGALGFLIFGLALLAIELNYRRLAGLALLAGLIGLATELQNRIPFNGGFDEWIAHDYLQVEAGAPGRMSTMISVCFVLGGLMLGWVAWPQLMRFRTLGIAFAGSAMMSVAFSTLIGYALSLPAVYRWGASTSVSPAAAILLFILGAALLTLAWREHQSGQDGAPVWLPMPVVVASTTLTLILWIGLRERELVYLGTNTQIAMNGLATAINGEFERQSSAVERLAGRWQAADASPVVWEVDAKVMHDDAPGNVAVMWISPALKTEWVYPKLRNEALMSYDQSSDPVRRAALRTVESKGPSIVSGTLNLPTEGAGFAIYAPIYRDGKIAGYAGADFVYRSLFETIDRRLKLSANYNVAVFIGSEKVYDTERADERANSDKLESGFTIFDRRVRVEMSPSLSNLRRNRRYLPELALAAGFGITLLLGLSVHLARTARAGQRAAELSNLKLVAENEERRRVEAMLKVSDERLRLALDSTQIGIFEWNLATNQVYYGAGLWTMLGYSPNAIGSSPEAWTALIHPEDLAGYRAATEQQLNGAAAFIDPEYRVRAANGEWRWLYSRSKAVSRSISGNPTRILGTLQDITARKQAEEALRLSQAETRKLSLVAAKTDNIVIIASPQGAVEWVNESFERIMEYSLEEVIGRNPAAFMIGPETNSRTIRLIRAAMTRGEGVSTDLVNYSKSGRKYHMHLEVQPVRNEAGVLENFIAIEADISARVETEQYLRRAKAEADAASRAKSEFLASMSHEIRTPMNGVIGMTSLLLDTSLNHEQRDFVNTIRTSGEALLTIINDILDFSKIESGKMELERVPFDLAVCVEEALDLFSAPAAAKKIELVYHIDDTVPPWILGDVTRLRQVLVNLVNNAVKFTPSGSIAVTVRRVSHSASPLQVASLVTLEFTVTDSGIGIPPERMNRLFRPFSQVDSSTTRKYGGTGLGLAICHRLCHLMGGDIGVSSTVGVGSAFTFTLQTENVGMPPGWGLPEAPARLSYGPVLCIEDHSVSQSRLQSFFANWSSRATCAATVEAAAEYLSGETKPVAVVLDYELTGSPAGRQLQEQIAQAEIPLLLLLPAGFSSNQLPSFATRRGTATVHKPLRNLPLVRAIQSLFDTAPESLPPFAGASDGKLLARDIPLEVLLVEDNAVNQKVGLRFLDRLGYRADAVANGLEAVNTLESRRYQLVLMDLQMPEMDGFEATRQIRRRFPADRQPKIIALTANALHGDRELCLAAGMDDYITKPVKLHDIADAIRRQFAPSSRTPFRS